MDGTLIDSARGVTSAVAHALCCFGIEPPADLAQLNKFVGLPIRDAFMEYYGFGDAKAAEALIRYREKFSTEGIYDNSAIPGIRELLTRLKREGYELIVATCKPEPFARMILDRLGLLEFFVTVGGTEFSSGRRRKGDVLRYALQKRSIVDVARTAVIGDRCYDIQAAVEAGAASIGVLWGYGTREELEAAGAAHIVSTVAELDELLRV
ncbi:MAG: HAD hydrolase-like protein [Rikenellaceae bacterium]|jgi:phosphoglycolate phosphatase|nr:HAD hydrolase-like protein [Rikenellaceae bacterium]